MVEIHRLDLLQYRQPVGCFRFLVARWHCLQDAGLRLLGKEVKRLMLAGLRRWGIITPARPIPCTFHWEVANISAFLGEL
jgi:hypothetical protein